MSSDENDTYAMAVDADIHWCNCVIQECINLVPAFEVATNLSE